MEVILCQCVNDLHHSLFHTPQLSHNDSLWVYGITKSHREQGLDIGRLRNCLDAHFGQIVCDKDRVVDWCIVLVEIPLTRFEECWPLPMESLPEPPLKPQHSNPNPLANQLWCSHFLTPPTPLIIPHRLRAFLESLMPLKNWCLIHAR